MTVIYVIVAVLIFGLLVMIHELGHFSVARLFGVHIDEFAIGMGPALLQKKTKKHGTLVSLRALPIGGYVGMKGENEDDQDEDSFSRKNVWQRIAIVAAGALMNLILGFLIVLLIVCTSEIHGSTTVHSFKESAISCSEGGLEVGDEILKVGDTRVYTYEELTYEIMNQGFEPLNMTVLRDGKRVSLTGVVFPNFEDKGVLFGESDFYVLAENDPSAIRLLGISWHRSVSLVKMVWDSVYNLLSGRYSVGALSSPIGVTAAVKDVITDSDWSGKQIVEYVLYITSVISINLGVFNLLPFPALDGGRLVFLAVEAVTRKRVPASVEARIHFVGIVLLMLLMVFVVSKDIVGLL